MKLVGFGLEQQKQLIERRPGKLPEISEGVSPAGETGPESDFRVRQAPFRRWIRRAWFCDS
jgi:hypothetical protein